MEGRGWKEFLVSPGFDLATVKCAREKGILMIPGALTPAEIIAAWNAGSDLVEISPVGRLAAQSTSRPLQGPLLRVPVTATGGVNLDTAADFILAWAEALGVDGELVSAAALKSDKTHEITDAAQQFAAIVREARGRSATVPSA